MKQFPLLPMISIACSLVLSSCGDLGSMALNSEATGIHTRSGFKFWSASKFTPISTVKSTNGFHPASVSESVAKKSKSFKKDKHGMPTYPDSVRSRIVRTTAYSHEENEVGAPWRKNAIGTYLKYGQVRSAAADWSRYPVGTKFKIKGLPHTYIVDDYGSALVGTNTIDIYHPNLSSMRRWGTRPAEISVIQWGDWDRTLNILAGRTKYPHTRKMYYAAKAKVSSGNVARN
ncbi:3D domain-containing protein [Akkermansiaceae bacterium]|nr:3D domain-containing protein [Akkermansiaceae bacterium]MDA7868433.1 3D domain-containing protein [bacterium]MDA7933734.1 3D domain-containing protein [Akkermansiaceae bacterium]MDB4383608.1 3D domain-containing protein [Akkermansiaceae bacterium]MDB4393531.1 3D domain-containing protein [bacterium]